MEISKTFPGPWIGIKKCLEVQKEAEPSFSAALDVQRREGLLQVPGNKGGVMVPGTNHLQGLNETWESQNSCHKWFLIG